MELTLIYLFFQIISKSALKLLKIISANNDSNWINILETEKPLFPSTCHSPTTLLVYKPPSQNLWETHSQPDFHNKPYTSCSKNLNIQHLWQYRSRKIKQLFIPVLTLLSCKFCIVYYRYCKDKLCNDLFNKSHSRLVQNQIVSKRTRNLLELALKLAMIYKRTILLFQII